MEFAKNIMSKKLFAWTNSLKKPHKLATDAVVLEENEQNAPGDDSSERTQSNALSISALSPEVGYSRYADSQMPVVRTTNNSLVEPSTPNNIMAQNVYQNVYQLSHMNGLIIGSNIQINNKVEQSTDRRSNSGDIIQKTKSIDAMMKSKEPVNERVMDVISTHLGENWRCLFRSLGFSDGQIDQMKENYYINGVKEVIYRLLLDYSRNNDDASLGHITKIMRKLGFNECVLILKVHWKNGDLVTTEKNSCSSEASCSNGKTVD